MLMTDQANMFKDEEEKGQIMSYSQSFKEALETVSQ